MTCADALVEAGVSVDRQARPQFDFTEAWHAGGWLIGAATRVSDGDRSISHTDWLIADRERARRRLRWAEFFESVDVLLCPVTLTPAFPHLRKARGRPVRSSSTATRCRTTRWRRGRR